MCFTDQQESQIEAAISNWMAKTCVRFQRVDVNATVLNQHILFATDPQHSHGFCFNEIIYTTADNKVCIHISL